MLERVVQIITRYSMFRTGDRVGVAVSGGADSLCLLHILLELAPRWDLRLNVLHLDHKLRGEESRQDAAFVREIAASLGLPFELGEIDVAAACRETAENLEQAARTARLNFYRGFLKQVGDRAPLLDRVAVGHTRSDQAETVLFRFLRGSGTAGLAGIRPVTGDGIVRPLIETEHAEVLQYLSEHGIAWRDDSTNACRAFARNRIRHELLPQLARDWNPSITATLAHTADWAQAEEAYWDSELARIVPAHLVSEPPAVLFRVDSLATLPLAASRRLIRRALEMAKGDLRGIGFEHLAAVLALASLAEGHGRMQIPGLDIFRSFEFMRIAPPAADSLRNRNYCLPLPVPGSARLPGQRSVIHAELVENTRVTEMLENVYNENVGFLDWRRISGPVEVRNWRPGDQYQPAGRAAAEKIKVLFHQARVPLWERRFWPVIASGGVIVWARRFGPAAGFAASPETSLVLTIRETVG
jgi:tRNA(Ile)-lysidine synthase